MPYTKEYFMKQAKLDKEYVPPAYGSPINSLFKKSENGKYVFDPDNWNSNQEVIRRELSIHDIISPNATFVSWISGPGKEKNELSFSTVTAHIAYESDTLYLSISVVNDDETPGVNQYMISWYKDRGRTALVTKNGQYIKLKEYIELCNILETAEFYNPKHWN